MNIGGSCSGISAVGARAGTYDDGVRVVRCPDTATALAWFRR